MSSFCLGSQMDHPLGPVISLTDTDTQTYSKAHTLSPANPTWKPFVICSSSALFAWIIWKVHLSMLYWRHRKRGHAVKNAHPDTLFELKGLVGHKLNRWCESWILTSKQSITVCFRTVHSFENGAVQLWLSAETKNWLCLSVEAKCF